MADEEISNGGEAGTSALDLDLEFPESFFENVSALELSALCCDEQLLGYDKNSGTTWIYPTNYSVRDYQFNIVQSALFKNTLVSLPTGLGKTFIAAVVMYNFYRWYPMGKIIFVAPTRPLVAQQIEACYNIMAIPQNDTIEMTGNTSLATRKLAWKQKRVFFATPQVVQNDLESGTCPGHLVRCLVIDEAHRARGRHSYCQLVESLIIKGHTLFRILALSATPGSKVEDVINVVQNLKIAHLELRSEECVDVAQYRHARNIQTVVIQLGEELTAITEQFISILDIYTRRLVQYKVLTGNIGGLSKGRIVMLFKEYQVKEKSLRHAQHNQIMKDFTMVITLYHAMELLTKHGARVFLNFFDEHNDKTWVGKDDRLTCFLERLRDDLGTNPLTIDMSTLPDGSVPTIKEELKFGHPKFDHLKKIIIEHFKNAENNGRETKAIVFCEYRESVNLVQCLLLQCRPLIKPHIFIGQGSGVGLNMKAFSQKQQLRVMKAFRDGECNVLVSTCVGEEGLDVGSVDLIICFDISNKSPIRLVQRCGRTGRERGGRVVILVTEGKEHQTLRECIFQRDNLNKRLLGSQQLKKNLYTASPRMIPQNIKPQCQKMFITVKKNQTEMPKTSKVQTKLKDLFAKCAEKDSTESPYLNMEEYMSYFLNYTPRTDFFIDIPMQCKLNKKEFTKACNAGETLDDTEKISLYKWLEWQRNLQYTDQIAHSSDTQMLSELLKYADTKRFNTCLTQDNGIQQNAPKVEVIKVQINKRIVNKKPIIDQSKRKNNIKDLFSKLNRMKNKELCLYDDKYKEFLSKCGIDTSDKDVIDTQLDELNVSPSLIDSMVKLSIEEPDFLKKDVENDTYNICDKIQQYCNVPLTDFKIPDESCIESLTLSVFNNINRTFIDEMDVSPEMQNNYDELFNDVIKSPDDSVEFVKENKNCELHNNNLDLIDLEAIFEDCSLEADVESSPKIENRDASKQPLDFFGLDNIDDIFADDSFDEPVSKSPDTAKNEVQKDASLKNDNDRSTSPILSSQYMVKNKKLSKSNSLMKNKKEVNDHKIETDVNCTLFSVTELVDMFQNDSIKECAIEQPVIDKDDICLDFLNDSDHSNDSKKSMILCSQRPKNKYNYSLKTNNTSRPNVVIPESSDSEIDYDQLEDIMHRCETKFESKTNKISETTVEKRRLSTSDESSPFFHKISKTDSPTLLRVNKLSLRDKLKTSMSNCASNIHNISKSLSFFDSMIESDKESTELNKSGESNQENVLINQLSQKFTCQNRSKRFKSDNTQIYSKSDSDEDFIRIPLKRISNGITHKHVKRKQENKKKKKPKQFCEFIDYEAILSEDSYEVSSDENVEADSNTTIGSFICDEQSEEASETVDMEAKYLQSVKSPVRNAGKFKIPAQPKIITDVFSQTVVEQDTNYELDSFCVDGDQGLTQHHEMSELEIAEQILKQRRTRKRNKNKFNKKANTSMDKKKTTIQESTSDDDSPIVNKKKRVRLRIGSGSSSDEFM